MTEMLEREPVPTLLTSLKGQLKDEELLLDERLRALYSQDIYASGAQVAAVGRPASTQALCKLLRFASQHSLAVLPRSGGMSYTKGYISDNEQALLIDMSALDAVLEIDETNMRVRVQTGCTWEKLYTTLAAKKLRTPYWGTLSGKKATIGGSLSNNSIFWGSGRYGSAADSVLGLRVALASGELLQTGGGAQINSELSFMRSFGPDLTGLFLADCGALGIKTEAELPLIDDYEFHGYASFNFATAEEFLTALCEISRRGLASECFGFDPVLQGQRLKRAGMREDLKLATGVVNLRKPLQSLASLLKLGMVGRSFAEGTVFGLHAIVSENTQACVERNLKAIQRIAESAGGQRIADSIPRVMQSSPFPPLNNIAGALGERWAPIHGLFPHSGMQEAYRQTASLIQKHADEMARLGIFVGYLMSAIGRSTSVLEPVFYWQDALQALHQQTMEPAAFSSLPQFPESLDTRAYVAEMRKEIAELYCQLGGTHLQIGRTYLYQEGLPECNRALLSTLKRHLDPSGIMNPGALGLT